MGRTDEVEVYDTFTGRWVGGFAVVDTTERGSTLRRLSDGAVIPAPIDTARVRPAQAPGK